MGNKNEVIKEKKLNNDLNKDIEKDIPNKKIISIQKKKLIEEIFKYSVEKINRI